MESYLYLTHSFLVIDKCLTSNGGCEMDEKCEMNDFGGVTCSSK